MRVLVVNNAAPFIRGGAEELADRLVRELNATKGVEAELLRIPFRWEPAECIADQILLNLNFKLYQVDRVVALKFPAYLIPHECKILWLLHQFRQAYDLYESGMSHLCNHQSGKQIVEIVRAADQQCFAKCRSIYTNSPVTQSRLRTYNGFESRVLYPPLLDEEKFVGGEYGNYIFAGGRIGPGKRQHLLIEAIAAVRSCPKLIVAGPLDDPDYGAHLEKLVEQHDCADRVALRFGFHSRDEIARLVNGSVACAYVPIDEDSLGYVTMEAFSAGKCAITTSDAGGVLEIVRQGETGLVSDAEPQSIAKNLTRIGGDRNAAIEMGRAAKALLASKGLAWQDTVARLLSV
jgi:glycosyltransferase involved in cell wall biosynthesis